MCNTGLTGILEEVPCDHLQVMEKGRRDSDNTQTFQLIYFLIFQGSTRSGSSAAEDESGWPTH